MANKKNVTTLTLPTALVEECKGIYNTDNTSAAIINALADFLLIFPAELELDTFAIYQLLPDPEVRHENVKFSIRIPRKLYNVILTLSDDNTFSETVFRMLSRTLYSAFQMAHSARPCSKLLYVWGNKWNQHMQDQLRIIKDTAKNVTWDTSVEVCAGGLGIHSNIKFADTEILNDLNWNTINLYKAIQENPRELIIRARSLNVDKWTFNQQKNLLKNFTPSSSVDYEAAACYLFLNINSYKSFCDTPDIPLNDSKYSKYFKRLESIYPLHQRLTQCGNPEKLATKLCNDDIFKVIEKYRKKENTLFIVDPPYLDADLYNDKKNEFGEEKHKHLANLLRLVKKNNGNDFIYFCRITAPKKYQSKPDAEAYNRHMKGCIEDLYWGHGFYYIDIPTLPDGTIERIITSFDFDGAIKFGKVGE